ncbi:MAG TPA: phosphoribosylglycinamide formyltransferase [Rhizomicrobium sp.]|jgi:phosphoribosylglycinamide formyltransferase-1|nr:phosphoribosylglycinamide formyltransferase [Rhizomicrobium sp.]
MPRTKTAVLISGRGSNLQALIDACARDDFPAEIALVISNVAEAEGLVRAKAAHIATHVISHKDFASRETFDAAVDTALRKAGIEIICLAGFMRILSDTFVTAWEGKLINIHPSLLPAFKGTHVHQRTLDAGVTQSGCTVHFVVPELDSGPIIAQAKVPVEKNDTVETLAARILAAEHTLYPEGLRLVASGAVKL